MRYGDTVVHSTFGVGVVDKINGSNVNVNFSGTFRVIDINFLTLRIDRLGVTDKTRLNEWNDTHFIDTLVLR